MKKVYALTLLAACAMMVSSCKNNNKENEAAPASDVVENCCGGSEDGCCEGSEGDCCAAEAEEAAADADEPGGESRELADAVQPYTSVEVKPTFNGGDADEFLQYINKNLKYPQSALENGESGKVIVSFVIGADGKVQNAKVVKGVSEALDAEALRVISESPDWMPARQGGENIPVAFSLPVTFALR